MKNIFTFLLLVFIGGQFLWGQPANLVWNIQSRNASESMPCGGGDIGMNVWVENDDVLFYLSRSGSFDENNCLLKQGRFRVRLTPNPFAGTALPSCVEPAHDPSAHDFRCAHLPGKQQPPDE